MKLSRLQFRLFFILSLFCTVTTYANPECAQLLALQAEIKSAARSYSLHTTSAFRGTEDSYTVLSNQEKAIVISLGSGPDVYRPLIDFPFVEQVHLVDILTGWGSGPGEIIFEIGRRLKGIHPSTVVEIVDPGFSEKVDSQKLAVPEGVKEWGDGTKTDLAPHFLFPESFWRGWYVDATFRRPMIWKVTWKSESQGRQSKLVFLHPLDFDKAEHIDELFASIGTKNVAGLLITGIGPPKNIKRFAEKLAPGKGVIVFEDFSRNGQRHTVLDELEKLGLKVTTVESDLDFKASMQEMSGAPKLTTYLIEP